MIVSDIRGTLPFAGHSLVSLEDARQRFLAEGGTMIPQRDTLYAAIVESGKFCDEIRSSWQSSYEGLDLSSALPCVLNDVHSTHLTQEQLVTEPQSWCVIEYMKRPNIRAAATLHFRTTRTGTAHGVAVWFDTQLFGQIGFSCAPGGPKTVYGHSFLPWLQPVTISAGQEIQLELHADLVGGDYIWRWETKIYEEGKGLVHHFRQSTLEGARFSPQWLRRHALDFVPVLSEAGEAERWLLEAMDGHAPLQEIAATAAERFPKVFRRQEEAFRRASELAEKFSR